MIIQLLFCCCCRPQLYNYKTHSWRKEVSQCQMCKEWAVEQERIIGIPASPGNQNHAASTVPFR
jgi:hypothetical protein